MSATTSLPRHHNKRGQLIIEFIVEHSGEPAAGLHAYTDGITVMVDSGDPGGQPGEFEAFVHMALSQWYDGAGVGQVR